ncbi:MAG: 3-dehydroquinate synthase [Planctomycetes bacterium]|nr:3-dehydroquinate synthase [Planctomycetota bacterium]
MQTGHIPLGRRAYDVLVDFDCLPRLGSVLRERALAQDNVAVITSPRIGGLYYESVEAGLREAGFRHVGRWDLPDGEESKNLARFSEAVEWLARFTPDPAIRPAVVALGGGVVGDLAGFAAASFRRGIPYVQAPTTLLAAVDSSVGGKTAVNLPEGKNLVGAFYQPRLVYVDLSTLETLEVRELRSGCAEVIKYGAALDADLFRFLEQSIEDLLALDREALTRVVTRCIELKADVVRRDEREEKRVRVCLNFGHTLGHAIEKASDRRLRHGECVAVGMLAAAHISVELGLCSAQIPQRLEALIRRAGLPAAAEGLDMAHVMEFVKHDKKFVTGANRFVVLRGIGQWQEYEGVPEELVREAAGSVLV